MISIIIPVYRSEKTLRRCVESLLAQTLSDIEIIMIVDGPPDASGLLADELALEDARIRVIHQANQGVSVARNTGIAAAKGEYIQFVDSDDYVEPSLCIKLLEALMQHHADLAVCGFHHLYFGRDVVKLPAAGVYETETSQEAVLLLYEQGFLNMPWNKLYRKALIDKAFPSGTAFPTGMDLGEDLLFNLAYLEQCGKIAALEEALCFYIQDDRGTTLSTKKRKNRMESAFFLYERLGEFCRTVYGNDGVKGILESRLMAEFLDELEGLAFEKELSVREKRLVLAEYYGGYQRLEHKENIHLKLADYRMIAFFFTRKWFGAAYCLIRLRGLLVKMRRCADKGKA